MTARKPLPLDGIGYKAQVFAPSSIQTAASGVAFSTDGILIVRVKTDCNYYINAASTATAPVYAGEILGVGQGVTSWTFDADCKLEVM
jgi:hypothetical protein